MPPYEISPGIIMSVVGGPFFIILLRRTGKTYADNLFEIKNLSFSYDKDKVIDDLSLTIKPGGVTTIIGANGLWKVDAFQFDDQES